MENICTIEKHLQLEGELEQLKNSNKVTLPSKIYNDRIVKLEMRNRKLLEILAEYRDILGECVAEIDAVTKEMQNKEKGDCQ